MFSYIYIFPIFVFLVYEKKTMLKKMIKNLKFQVLLLIWNIINILYILFLSKHGLSKKLSLFCYKFMLKYLQMNVKFSFKKMNGL
jgi:hypothetical protein